MTLESEAYIETKSISWTCCLLLKKYIKMFAKYISKNSFKKGLRIFKKIINILFKTLF